MQADPAVPAEGSDLDRPARAGHAGQHLQVQAVEPADLDCREPLADRALPHFEQDRVLGAEDLLGPPGQGDASLAESLLNR